MSESHTPRFIHLRLHTEYSISDGIVQVDSAIARAAAERLSSLAAQFVPRSVPAGTDVVRFGEQGSEFYLVAKGAVDVLSSEGKKLVTLGDGDHFGEIALLRSVPRTATVRAVTDTLLLVLSREVFLEALNADLSLSAKVEKIVAAREKVG